MFPNMQRTSRHLALLSVLIFGLAACATKPRALATPQVSPPPAAAPSPSLPAVPLPNGSESRAPMVVQGSGLLVVPPPTGSPSSTRAPAGNGYQLNFVDTDVATVVGAVLGDGLNLPYVVDPQVKGTMTLQAARPLSQEEVLAALESALRTQGAALISVDGVYHVVPAKDAARHITNLQAVGTSAHGYGTYVVPLQYVGAAEMEKVLQPFAPEGGIIRVDEGRNTLLLAGTSQEISTLLNVVKTFDVDWLAGMSFGLYPLNYVDAKTLVGELDDVFTGGKSPLAGVVRFVPLTRLNAVMVVTPQPKYLQDAAAWIKRLDLGSTTPGRRIYVYDVQNAKADDLAASLSQILGLRDVGGQSNAPPPFVSPGASANASGHTGSFGPAASSMSFGAGSTQPYAMSGGASGTASSALSNAPGLTNNSRLGSNLEQGGLSIVPNSDNNALMILASPSEFAVIEAALKRLDVLPIQVLIEASIAEVTLNDELKYGLQWSYKGPNGNITFSEASNGSISQQFPGLSFLYTGNVKIPAVLNALETLSNVKVLSSPKLMVLNNREATLEVGDQVPIAVQSSVATVGSNSPIVNSLELQQTGVILHITPRANKSGEVILEVSQEVSAVVPTTTSSLDSPTIQQRRLASTVSVRDGQTLALGGMIQETYSKAGDGIPFLRRIPLLGELFGSTDKKRTRTELIVLLTPHVIRSDAESAAAMEDLEEEFRGLQRDMRGLLPVPPDAAKKNTTSKAGDGGHAADSSSGPPTSAQ